LPEKSNNSLLTYVTFQLQTLREFQLPPDAVLGENNMTEIPQEEELPDFVQQLEQELHVRRSPQRDVSLTAWSNVILLTVSHFRRLRYLC
jgi:hypothetical protein